MKRTMKTKTTYPFITTYDEEYIPEEMTMMMTMMTKKKLFLKREHEPLDENEVEELFDDTMNDMWLKKQPNPNQHQEEEQQMRKR